jgi:hypothetical protein
VSRLLGGEKLVNQGGGREKKGWKRMRRKMKAVTGESPLRLSSTKGTRLTRKEMTKRGLRLRGMRRSGRERGQGHMTRLPNAASGLVSSDDFTLDESIVSARSAPPFSCSLQWSRRWPRRESKRRLKMPKAT